MNQFEIEWGFLSKLTGKPHSLIESEFNTYEEVVKKAKIWCEKDVDRYAIIRFSNTRVARIIWFDNEIQVFEPAKIEDVARAIREKGRNSE